MIQQLVFLSLCCLFVIASSTDVSTQTYFTPFYSTPFYSTQISSHSEVCPTSKCSTSAQNESDYSMTLMYYIEHNMFEETTDLLQNHDCNLLTANLDNQTSLEQILRNRVYIEKFRNQIYNKSSPIEVIIWTNMAKKNQLSEEFKEYIYELAKNTANHNFIDYLFDNPEFKSVISRRKETILLDLLNSSDYNVEPLLEKLVVDHDVAVDDIDENSGNSVVMELAMRGFYRLTHKILSEYDFGDINHVNNEGNSLMMLLSYKCQLEFKGNERLLDLMDMHGIDYSLVNDNGENTLMIMIRSHCKKPTERLYGMLKKENTH